MDKLLNNFVLVIFALAVRILCLYGQDVQFAGRELITLDLSEMGIADEKSRITFRLKTIYSFGLILYSRGTQGDYIVIEIVQGSLRYKADMGSIQGQKVSSKQEITAGKNLDNNLWHSIDIKRDSKTVNITIDGKLEQSVTYNSKQFTKLDLDDKLYLGGLLQNTYVPKSIGIMSRSYIGCLRNFIFEPRNMLYSAKHNEKNYRVYGDIKYECDQEQYVPITFPRAKSVITLPTDITQSLSLQLSFRSYLRNGLLFSKLSKNGNILIEIKQGQLVVRVEAPGKSPTRLGVGNELNDGLWHAMDVLVNREEVSVTIDKEKPLRYKNPALGDIINNASFVTIGGGAESIAAGFQGCIYRLTIDKAYIDARLLQEKNKKDVLVDRCDIKDHCRPNPCHNKGLCHQTATGFKCNCKNTLYNGKRCKEPIVQRTCQDYKLLGLKEDSYCKIDPDGAGPVNSFEVLCNMTQKDEAVTVIKTHKNMKRIRIGDVAFFKHNKYYHHIDYFLSENQMQSIIKASTECRQFVKYECRNSLLLNSPTGPSHVRWVNQAGVFEDYWGGAPNTSFKCACGVKKACADKTKYCNCDKGDDVWREDSGYLTDKTSLPVKLIQFDVTTSNSFFVVGNLECSSKRQQTSKHADARSLRVCRPVNPKTTITTKSATTLDVLLPQTEKVISSKYPRKSLTRTFNRTNNYSPITPTVDKDKDPDTNRDSKSNRNMTMNGSRDKDKPQNGLTISMSILAVIVISVSVVAVWAIIAVIVIVRRTRNNTNSSRNQDQEAEGGTEMCVFFRQSRKEINRPTIELQRDSYDSSPEPPAILDYTEYTGFRQPITTHITLDYGKSKKKGGKHGYLC